MSKQYEATEIAQIFVRKGISDGYPVTQMKLQKLVYFAHGLFLAETNGNPLIKEKFEAWRFGPVVPEIYHSYKYYGSGEILDTSIFYKTLPHFDKNIELDQRAKEVINTTWEALKDSSGIRLSNWTHRKDSAWDKVYRADMRNVIIPNDLIELDFHEFIEPA